jgi:hypothetical protein
VSSFRLLPYFVIRYLLWFLWQINLCGLNIHHLGHGKRDRRILSIVLFILLKNFFPLTVKIRDKFFGWRTFFYLHVRLHQSIMFLFLLIALASVKIVALLDLPVVPVISFKLMWILLFWLLNDNFLFLSLPSVFVSIK